MRIGMAHALVGFLSGSIEGHCVSAFSVSMNGISVLAS